jgi:hypothetical protein
MSSQNRRVKHLNRLSALCANFATCYGKVSTKVRKRQAPNVLTMRFEDKNLLVEVLVFIPKQADAMKTCKICVKESKDIVFAATGSFSTKPFNMKAATYAPGDWEERISR